MSEKVSRELIYYIESQPKQNLEQYSWLLYSNYYNLACLQSLLNKKSDAIQSLNKAVENGHQDYAHTLRDSDLDNIRNESGI